VLLPFTLDLKPSVRLAIALAVAHIWAAVGLVAVRPSDWIGFAGIAVLASSFVVCLLRHVLRPQAVALTLKGDGGAELHFRDGNRHDCQVCPGTMVLPWLVVARFKIGSHQIPLVVLPDAVAEGLHSTLRLWLRWKATGRSL
jgi:hypothetical protein